MIPARVALALQDAGWYLRSDIIWHKPNSMPESVKDRPSSSHEHIFLLSKSYKYYYDADAIREPTTESTKERGRYGWNGRTGDVLEVGARSGSTYQAMKDGKKMGDTGMCGEYRNKRDVWTVSLNGCKDAHFATFPPDLIKPCILAGCPQGGTVLDPFTGSGTTGMVCMREGRQFTGIELNPEYFEIAQRRIVEASAQKSLFYFA